MAHGLRLIVGLCTAFAAIAASPAGTAHANVGIAPRLEFSCLRSQTVYRPETGTLSKTEPGEKVRLNAVTICKAERRACFAFREEVPMSRCTALH